MKKSKTSIALIIGHTPQKTGAKIVYNSLFPATKTLPISEFEFWSHVLSKLDVYNLHQELKKYTTIRELGDCITYSASSLTNKIDFINQNVSRFQYFLEFHFNSGLAGTPHCLVMHRKDSKQKTIAKTLGQVLCDNFSLLLQEYNRYVTVELPDKFYGEKALIENSDSSANVFIIEPFFKESIEKYHINLRAQNAIFHNMIIQLIVALLNINQ